MQTRSQSSGWWRCTAGQLHRTKAEAVRCPGCLETLTPKPRQRRNAAAPSNTTTNINEDVDIDLLPTVAVTSPTPSFSGFSDFDIGPDINHEPTPAPSTPERQSEANAYPTPAASQEKSNALPIGLGVDSTATIFTPSAESSPPPSEAVHFGTNYGETPNHLSRQRKNAFSYGSGENPFPRIAAAVARFLSPPIGSKTPPDFTEFNEVPSSPSTEDMQRGRRGRSAGSPPHITFSGATAANVSVATTAGGSSPSSSAFTDPPDVAQSTPANPARIVPRPVAPTLVIPALAAPTLTNNLNLPRDQEQQNLIAELRASRQELTLRLRDSTNLVERLHVREQLSRIERYQALAESQLARDQLDALLAERRKEWSAAFKYRCLVAVVVVVLLGALVHYVNRRLYAAEFKWMEKRSGELLGV